MENNQKNNFKEFKSEADVFNLRDLTKPKLNTKIGRITNQPNDTSLGKEVISNDQIQNDISNTVINPVEGNLILNQEKDNTNNNQDRSENVNKKTLIQIAAGIVISIVVFLIL